MIATTVPGFEVVARHVAAGRTSWGVGIQAYVPPDQWDAACGLILDKERRLDAALFLSHARQAAVRRAGRAK